MDGREYCFLWSRRLVRRLSLASVVRFPDRHDRNRGWFRCRPPVFPVGRSYWFCGGHGPGETPGPFPNPEAKAWHGDGTALERVWESSAPPHSTSEDLPVESPWGIPGRSLSYFPWGFPPGATPREPPFFMLCFGVRFPWRAGGSHSMTPPLTWSVSVTVINDVMRLTRYVRAGSRESRYDGKRQKPDN